MSTPDLPDVDEDGDADSRDDGEDHPLEVGLDAAERHDTAGLDEILDDVDD